GLGTRFLPATKAQPKEMLPIVDKPLIQYAVEEAYAAGAREMIFVTGRNKRSIEDHFDTAHELESALAAKQQDALLALVRSIKPADMDCVYIRQSETRGLGHAVGCAERLVGNEPFLVLLADDLLVGEPPVCSQLVALHAQAGCSVLATEEVPREHTRRYGIVAGPARDARVTEVERIVEKPLPEAAPSTQAVVGRYLLSPRIFAHIRRTPPGANGELQLTDAIASLLAEERVLALRYQGRRYDCGSKLGYLQATVEMARIHPDVGAQFSAFLAGEQAGTA
ncbi:MAG: UTP--glucose-1-phosphate uridylyltransferase GalU, partial [Betaproteobacteria bacterium]|nr:UTP--glucose-1-phosphate uridylyltransferase GalU [Betaproteobacteria bacterium]